MAILKTYTTYLPTFGMGNRARVAVMAVLSEDLTGQQAVYIGGVPESVGSDLDYYDRIAARIEGSGAKQTFRDAGNYFKGLDESKYRR